jgi:hypothetical protein
MPSMRSLDGTDASPAAVSATSRFVRHSSSNLRVRFESPAGGCFYDITPYAEFYGIHPDRFNFDASGNMVPTDCSPAWSPAGETAVSPPTRWPRAESATLPRELPTPMGDGGGAKSGSKPMQLEYVTSQGSPLPRWSDVSSASSPKTSEPATSMCVSRAAIEG